MNGSMQVRVMTEYSLVRDQTILSLAVVMILWTVVRTRMILTPLPTLKVRVSVRVI